MLARPLRISRISPVNLTTRTYAISVETPRVYLNKTVPRVYSDRKTYLYNRYTTLLKGSESSPLIFFNFSDFSIPRLVQLRRDVAAAAAKHATPPSLTSATPAPAITPTEVELPTFQVIRTSVFGVALREYSPIDAEKAKDIAKLVKGNFAILTLPNLNPPQLNAVLRVLQRTVPPRKPKTPEQLADEKKAAEASFVPGRRPKRQRPNSIPELNLVGALIEGRVFAAEGVRDVAKLPMLDTIRAQLVGLLSAPAAQLAMVLSEASGGKLARTLEGLKKSLEDEQNGGSAPPSS